MKILKVQIEGFGRFANLNLGPFQRPMVIFHGPNEAGKTTLMEFIRRVLFGFPDGRSRLNLYRPLRGGRHGGGLVIASDNDEVVTVRRTSGRQGGQVTLTTEDGAPLSTTELGRFMGNATKDVFEKVFSFTLDELHSDELLSDESVNGQIYGAGMGVATLPKTMKELEKKNTLFLKGGRQHDIAKAANQLRDIESRLEGIENHAREFARLTTELNHAETTLKEKNAELRKRQTLVDDLKRNLNAWDDWIELESTEKRLVKLPTIENFPQDGVNRLEKLEERVNTANIEHDRAGRRLANAEAEVGKPVEHEAILNHSDAINHLERSRNAFDASVRDLPKREAELKEHDRNLKKTMRDLGPDWNESRLENFDLSLIVQNDILDHESRLNTTQTEIGRIRAELAQREVELEEARQSKSAARQRLDQAAKSDLDAEQIGQYLRLIETASSRLRDLKSAQERTTTLQDQLDSLAHPQTPTGLEGAARYAAAVAAAAGITLIAVGAVAGGLALPIGLVAGIVVLAALAAILLYQRLSDGAGAESPLAASIRESLNRAEDEQARLQTALEQDATELNVEAINDECLFVSRTQLEEKQERQREWKRLSDLLDEARRLTNQRQERVERSREAVKKAQQQTEDAELAWKEWLRARGLRDQFRTETITELHNKVELGLAHVQSVQDYRLRIAGIQKDIDEYTDAVETLALGFGVQFDEDAHHKVAAVADRLIEVHREVVDVAKDRTAAKEELQQAKQAAKEREADVLTAQEELKALLQSGGVTGAEEFRGRAKQNSERTELEAKRNRAANQLQRASGPGQALESLKQRLREDGDLQIIREKTNQAKAELETVQNEIGALNTERGRIQAELGQLIDEEESSKLRMERERLIEEIRHCAREWTKRTLAERLLKEAQRKFEQERQPDVVRHAKAFFQGITGGRYDRVYSPIGDDKKTITVTDGSGLQKEPAQLSRGTREQLFLSMRFGLVRDLGERTESLPMIVDEVLVNFDADRALRAARAFIELSRYNQVLVFTCHPAIVEVFQKASADTHGASEPQVIDIGD